MRNTTIKFNIKNIIIGISIILLSIILIFNMILNKTINISSKSILDIYNNATFLFERNINFNKHYNNLMLEILENEPSMDNINFELDILNQEICALNFLSNSLEFKSEILNVQEYFNIFKQSIESCNDNPLTIKNKYISLKEYGDVLNISFSNLLSASSTNLYEYQQKKYNHLLIIKQYLSILIFFIAIILGALIFNTNNKLKVILTYFNSVFKSISNYDFTRRMDELKSSEFNIIIKALNKSLDTISSILNPIKTNVSLLYKKSSRLNDISNEMNTISMSISDTTKHLSIKNNQQIEDLTSIMSNLKTFLYNFDKTLDTLDIIKNESINISKTANISQNELITTKNIMSTFLEEFDIIQNKTSNLNNEIYLISDILNTLNTLTYNINLLSINAHIEAAKSDVENNGFVVIADEIRKLSEQTRSYTNNIEDKIYKIKDYSTNVQETINNTYVNFKEYRKTIDKNILSFEYIANEISSITPKLVDFSNTLESSKEASLNIEKNGLKLLSTSKENNNSYSHIVNEISKITSTSEDILINSKELNDIALALSLEIKNIKS